MIVSDLWVGCFLFLANFTFSQSSRFALIGSGFASAGPFPPMKCREQMYVFLVMDLTVKPGGLMRELTVSLFWFATLVFAWQPLTCLASNIHASQNS